MDVNETLRAARELAADIHNPEIYVDENTADRMAELFTTIDEWLTKGGFLPDAWKRKVQSRDVAAGLVRAADVILINGAEFPVYRVTPVAGSGGLVDIYPLGVKGVSFRMDRETPITVKYAL